MTAILYEPGHAARKIPAEDLNPVDFTKAQKGAADLLQCPPAQIDVLASGLGYMAFSVFDHEGEINLEAMRVLTQLTGISFNVDEEDEVLRGPILIVREA